MRKIFKFFTAFTLLSFASCGSPELSRYTSRNAFVVDAHPQTSGIDTLIEPYRTSMQEFMGTVVGFTDSSFEKYGPESPLGNLIADMVFDAGLFYAAKRPVADLDLSNTICLLNFGGLRSEIQIGPITRRQIYELMPFDNALSIVCLSPDSVNSMLNYLDGCSGQPVSNARLILGENTRSLEVGGERFSPLKKLYVITSDYLADGGDEMSFFSNHTVRYDSGLLIRDIIFEYVSSNNPLVFTPIEGRVIILEE